MKLGIVVLAKEPQIGDEVRPGFESARRALANREGDYVTLVRTSGDSDDEPSIVVTSLYSELYWQRLRPLIAEELLAAAGACKRTWPDEIIMALTVAPRYEGAAMAEPDPSDLWGHAVYAADLVLRQMSTLDVGRRGSVSWRLLLDGLWQVVTISRVLCLYDACTGDTAPLITLLMESAMARAGQQVNDLCYVPLIKAALMHNLEARSVRGPST